MMLLMVFFVAIVVLCPYTRDISLKLLHKLLNNIMDFPQLFERQHFRIKLPNNARNLYFT